MIRQFSRLLMLSVVIGLCCGLSTVPVAADEELFAQPPFTYLAPVPDATERMYTTYGHLLSYRVGDDYGKAVFHDSHGRTVEMVIGGNATIEGQQLECIDAPSPTDNPTAVTCPDWPHDIVLWRTPLRIVYWITMVGNHPVAVLQSLNLYRSYR